MNCQTSWDGELSGRAGTKALAETFDFDSEQAEAALHLGDAALKRFLRHARGLLEQEVQAGARHLRHVADAVQETEIAQLFILFFGKAEAYHVVFGSGGH